MIEFMKENTRKRHDEEAMMEEILSKLPPFTFSSHYVSKLGAHASAKESSMSQVGVLGQKHQSGLPESFRTRSPVILQDAAKASCSPRCWLATPYQEIQNLEERVTFYYRYQKGMSMVDEQARPTHKAGSYMRASATAGSSMQASSLQEQPPAASPSVALPSSGEDQVVMLRPQPPAISPPSLANKPRPGRTISAGNAQENPPAACKIGAAGAESKESPLSASAVCSGSEPLTPPTPTSSSSDKVKSLAGASSSASSSAVTSGDTRSPACLSPAVGTSSISSSNVFKQSHVKITDPSDSPQSKPSASASSTTGSAGSPSKQPQMPKTPAPSKSRPGMIKGFLKGLFSSKGSSDKTLPKTIV